MRNCVLCAAVALALTLPALAEEPKPAGKPVVKDKYAPRPGDVQIELEAFTLTNAPVVESDRASGGKAVDFAKETARAETTATLPKGDYLVELFLKGPTLDNDTVWVKVGDGEPAKTYPSHPRLPMVDFWQSLMGGRTQPVTITVAEERKTLAVVITPKETGMLLDRIIFRLQAKAK
jgi:hypothetical protein